MKRTRNWIITLAITMTLAAPAAAVERLRRCTTIDQPGSYLVVRDIVASGDCFVIESSQVTLDLGGHSITGDGTGAAVTDVVSRRAVTVLNGSIADFANAIDLITSQGVQLRDLNIWNTAGDAIQVGNRSTVLGNTLTQIGGVGILISSTSVVKNNTIDTVSGVGAEGIFDAGGASVIENNTVNARGTAGIVGNRGSTIVGNTVIAFAGTAAGILGQQMIVKGNNVAGSGAGIDVGCPSNVIDNLVESLAGPGTEIVAAGLGCNVANNSF